MATVSTPIGDPALPGHRSAGCRPAGPRDRRRRAPRARRSVRLRQVDGAAHARRARGARRRPDLHRRPRRERRAPARPRHRHGLPELRALPAPHRGREHGVRARSRRACRRRSGSPRCARRRASSTSSRTSTASPRTCRVASASASRWAGRSCAGRGVPDGRAAVEPRRQAARADPHRAGRAADAARRHDGLRHPRPGRGDDDGPPGRGAQGRHPAAGRHAARAVPRARQPVRRRLHRLAGDEPRAVRRVRRDRSAARARPLAGRPRLRPPVPRRS